MQPIRTVRSYMKIINSIFNRLKIKPGLFILFFILTVIIVILLLIPSKPSSTPQPSPSPTSTDANIQPFAIKPFQATKLKLPKLNQLLALDQKNSHLIKITPDETTTIYPKPVKNFSQKDSLIAIINTQDRQSLTILNLDTNQSNTIDLSSISPLIDVSFDPHTSNLYLLANLDTIKRTTKLYQLSLDNLQPQLLTTTKATNLQTLANQNILLFAYADAQDLSTVSIYHAPSSTTVFSVKANRYLISPDQNSICTITSQTITTLNLSDSSTKTFNLSAVLGGYWESDSKLVLFKNTAEGVNQTTITPLTTTPSFNLVSNLKDKTLRSIIGYRDNQLYAIDYFGQLVKISL